MLNAHLTRQHDLIPEAILDRRINIIGAGAIGSFAALQLAKMGLGNLHVWDDDKVSVENMSCQFYRFKDIGTHKVLALKDLIKDFTGIEINAHTEKFDGGALPGIVISAVDSMSARRLIFQHQKTSLYTTWIIDPRMSALDASLYTVRPQSYDDAETYEGSLIEDSEAVQERCTAKSTMFTTNLISGLVAKTVVDCLTDVSPPHTHLWSIRGNDLVTFRRKDA